MAIQTIDSSDLINTGRTKINSNFTDLSENKSYGLEEVADDDEITITTGIAGWGYVMAGDNEEYSRFRFSSSGVVTLDSYTVNVTDSDSDGYLCIYDAGTGIAIKNRLGSSKKIRYEIYYLTP
jgi:hypothetical protein